MKHISCFMLHDILELRNTKKFCHCEAIGRGNPLTMQCEMRLLRYARNDKGAFRNSKYLTLFRKRNDAVHIPEI